MLDSKIFSQYFMLNKNETKGMRGDFYSVNGATVNVRWLRHVYFAKRILNLNVLGQRGVWADVGSYYRGL